MRHNPIDISKQLRQIPVIRQAGLLAHKKLTVGSSNVNHLINTHQGQWVVRLNRPNLGVDRTLEAEVLVLISPLNLAPKVIENNPQAGYLITEYDSGPVWQIKDFKTPRQIKALKHQLDQMHAIHIDNPNSRLDIRTQHYIEQIGVVSEPVIEQTMQVIEQLETLGFWQENRYLFHSDLNPGNLLGHPSPVIIDWEFAGQGHPLIDWLIIELVTQTDMSTCYPNNMDTDWIIPCRQFLQLMLQIWYMKKPEQVKN